jgi:magnesium transporter
VTLLPLTLLTGLFGMNVDFPGEGTHAAFWAILVALLVMAAATLGFFRWRRWL